MIIILDDKVKRIHQIYVELCREYTSYAMGSRPDWCLYYNDIADHYEDGADACEVYFETKDLLSFVKKLNEIGFHEDVLSLKDYTEDPLVLEEIKVAEEEIINFECC